MQFLKFVALFTKNNFLQLRRKWRTLPLLLLFPCLLIGLVAFIVVSYFTSLEEEVMEVGLVDLDQSPETEMIMALLEQSSQLGDFLELKQLAEDDAKEKIKQGELVAYILFPEQFTQKLMDGDSVVVTVIGNPDKPTESYLIRELVNSAARHISTSQANILTINRYLHEFGMDAETRNQVVLEQFNDFLLYAIGRDNILKQDMLSNNVTSSPKEYFALAASFFIITVWIFSIYQLLIREQPSQIETRMSLYGVTALQQIFARILVTFFLSTLLGPFLLFGVIKFLELDLLDGNGRRMVIVIACYVFIYLLVIGLIEIMIHSRKIRLFTQVILTGTLLLASGSFIPAIYLPLYVQDYLPFIFSYQAFHWLEELIVNQRMFVDYIPLVLSIGICLFALVGISFWKERVKS